jgi:hypothetical protein
MFVRSLHLAPPTTTRNPGNLHTLNPPVCAQAELPLLALRAAAEQVIDQPKHHCILAQVVIAALDQLPPAVACRWRWP